MKLTVSAAKNAIAKAAGLCATDSRVIDYINEAVQSLLPKGKWVGTYQRYLICTNESCLVWPRQIETIEAMAICNRPGVVRNDWFEFLENGPGVLTTDSCIDRTAVDRGTVCAFNDITVGALDRYIRVYADVAEDAAAVITLQGYDENGQWIRTQVSGTWIDGERVAISTTPTLSTKFFTRLVRVIKPVTNGHVRLYEYDSVGLANVQALAVYEPDETLPEYRKTFIPSLVNAAAGSDCENVKVEVAAKLRYLPVSVDNDFIMLGNLRALCEMVRALRKYENDLIAEAQAYEATAVRYLQEELKSYKGDGPVVQLRTQNTNIWAAGYVENVI